MKNDYIIRRLAFEEIDKLNELQIICFRRALNSDLWKWKYYDNPAGEVVCMAAEYNNIFVGTCSMVPEDFYIFGKKKKIYKYVTLMVHPDHRKKGISTRLILSLSEYLKQTEPLFLYNFCTKNATPGFLKNGWIKLDNLFYYFKHNKQLKLKFLFKNIDNLFKLGVLREIDSVSQLCEEYTFKVDNTKIHIVKDEQYLKWRINNPKYQYSIIGYYENGFLKGYIILNVGANNFTYIVDIDTENITNSRIAKVLIDAAEYHAMKNNHRLIITLTINNNTFQKTIKKHNYIVNPFKKGPLRSLMDFNILIDKSYGSKVFDKFNWDVYSLHYDDI